MVEYFSFSRIYVFFDHKVLPFLMGWHRGAAAEGPAAGNKGGERSGVGGEPCGGGGGGGGNEPGARGESRGSSGSDRNRANRGSEGRTLHRRGSTFRSTIPNRNGGGDSQAKTYAHAGGLIVYRLS